MQPHVTKGTPLLQASPHFTAINILADSGIAIFPARPDKVPYITDWQAKATTGRAQLFAWWTQWPDAMPAIPTGHRNGIIVLDIDKKNGKDGFAALNALGFNLENLSPVKVTTPNDGLHIYFKWAEGLGNSASGLPTGVDVRGEGGFVIAYGAENSFGSYRLCEMNSPVKISDLPSWPTELYPQESKPVALPKNTVQSLDAIRDAVMRIPNDGSIPEYDSRDWWFGIIAALNYESGGSAEGL